MSSNEVVTFTEKESEYDNEGQSSSENQRSDATIAGLKFLDSLITSAKKQQMINDLVHLVCEYGYFRKMILFTSNKNLINLRFIIRLFFFHRHDAKIDGRYANLWLSTHNILGFLLLVLTIELNVLVIFLAVLLFIGTLHTNFENTSMTFKMYLNPWL